MDVQKHMPNSKQMPPASVFGMAPKCLWCFSLGKFQWGTIPKMPSVQGWWWKIMNMISHGKHWKHPWKMLDPRFPSRVKSDVFYLRFGGGKPLRNVLPELHRCGVGESFRSLGKPLSICRMFNYWPISDFLDNEGQESSVVQFQTCEAEHYHHNTSLKSRFWTSDADQRKVERGIRFKLRGQDDNDLPLDHFQGEMNNCHWDRQRDEAHEGRWPPGKMGGFPSCGELPQILRGTSRGIWNGWTTQQFLLS